MWKPSSLFSFRSSFLDSFNLRSVTTMNPSPFLLDALIDITFTTRISSKIGGGDYEDEEHQFNSFRSLGRLNMKNKTEDNT